MRTVPNAPRAGERDSAADALLHAASGLPDEYVAAAGALAATLNAGTLREITRALIGILAASPLPLGASGQDVADLVARRCANQSARRRVAAGLNRRLADAKMRAARALQMLGNGPVAWGQAPRRTPFLTENLLHAAWRRLDNTDAWAMRHHKLDAVRRAPKRQLSERRCLWMARGEICRARGMVPLAITIDLPSRFHSALTLGNGMSVRNGHSDLALGPADGAAFLQQLWEDVRTAFSNSGLRSGEDYEFLLVRQAHVDLTLHLHGAALLYHQDVELLRPTLARLLGPGARFEVEPIRKEGGWSLYITRLLAEYAEARAAGTMPNAECLAPRMVGGRSISSTQHNLDAWRWLWTCTSPERLTPELVPLWEGLQAGRGGKSLMMDFFQGPACEYRASHTIHDTHIIQWKTWGDYLQEAQGDIELALALQTHSEDADRIRSMRPRLDANRRAALLRIDDHGRVHIARLGQAPAALKPAAVASLTQLGIEGQGNTVHPETRTNAGSPGLRRAILPPSLGVRRQPLPPSRMKAKVPFVYRVKRPPDKPPRGPKPPPRIIKNAPLLPRKMVVAAPLCA